MRMLGRKVSKGEVQEGVVRKGHMRATYGTSYTLLRPHPHYDY